MPIDRRTVLSGGLTAGAGLGAALATGPRRAMAEGPDGGIGVDARIFGVRPNTSNDQSRPLQKAINKAAASGRSLLLPPGRYRIANINLPSGADLVGVAGRTILEYAAGGTLLGASNANDIRLTNLVLDGSSRPLDPSTGSDGLISITACAGVVLKNLIVSGSLLNGISLRRSECIVTDCELTGCANTGLFSLDGRNTRITHNTVHRCGNNGIQVWRTSKGEDGTVVHANSISHIESRAGGEGQNGNGISVFRAGDVSVANNRITDCAFTAIRGNGASNIQMVGNHCQRLGEVALYAEFGFEGALIANNLIDDAATGISVTNFNEGGRLAVVQGNLIRNLKFRDHPVDKRGTGIGVEADTAVVANVIEGAPSAGIKIGWGRYMRTVNATSNIIRNAGIGIAISNNERAGAVLVANNMITDTVDGAIRLTDHGRPQGPDMARANADPMPNITITGNVTV